MLKRFMSKTVVQNVFDSFEKKKGNNRWPNC